MWELIQIKNDIPRVSTSMISSHTNNDHRSIIRILDDYKDDFLEFWKIEEWKENLKCDFKSHLRKWKSKVYYLNEEQSTLLITYLRNSEIVRKFKKQLVREFFKMRKVLNNLKIEKLNPEYQQIRIEWKIVRKTFTDTIQILEQYAKSQNPDANTKFLYSNYTRAINTWLFDIEWQFKNIREVCDKKQLKRLEILEEELSDIIIEEINKQVPYKEIYYIIKDKIEWFTKLFWKTKVINLRLN